MHKKKIQALIVAGALSVGVIGGTLAWFTSEDSVTNIFNTGAVDNPDINAGIDVDENFKGPDGSQIVPDETGNSTYDKPVYIGDKFTKEVWVDSEANYDQFVRARIEKSWKIGYKQEAGTGYSKLEKDAKVNYYKIVKETITNKNNQIGKNEDGTPKYEQKTVNKVVYAYYKLGETVPEGWSPLDYSKIQLGFTAANFNDNTDSNKPAKDTKTWFAPKGFNADWEDELELNDKGEVIAVDTTNIGEWYYYNKILEPKHETDKTKGRTVNILESVTFRQDKGSIAGAIANTTVTIDDIYKTLRFDVAIKGESVQASNGAAADLGWDTTVPVAKANVKKYGEAKKTDSEKQDPGTETKN